jgi:regulator of RNase E activity RraA
VAGRSDVAPRVGGPVECGGVRVSPGDLVVADDDGIVIAPRARLEACLERAEAIERTEAAVLGAVQGGASLIELTNLADHVAALRRGEKSALAITPPE